MGPWIQLETGHSCLGFGNGRTPPNFWKSWKSESWFGDWK